MTDIQLHKRAGIGWTSWNTGRGGFSQIHLERREYPAHVEGKTLCGVNVPTVGRIVRDQFSAALEDLCRSCLKRFAAEGR